MKLLSYFKYIRQQLGSKKYETARLDETCCNTCILMIFCFVLCIFDADQLNVLDDHKDQHHPIKHHSIILDEKESILCFCNICNQVNVVKDQDCISIFKQDRIVCDCDESRYHFKCEKMTKLVYKTHRWL